MLRTIQSTPMYCTLHPWVAVTSYLLDIKDHIKSYERDNPFTSSRISLKVSGSRLMFTICDPLYSTLLRSEPLDVAQQNEQEFVVDGILAHRGNHHRRSTMEFLVQRAGYDESSNSWEPYKALMHVDKLHDYLREHRMRALIPREHK